ncbi:MAG TPA: tetratricopeptide repeat protein, partial [Patescibacteria group bacterium]|nr:tetratricopeptide repeat protein [Patescibacteria group bacterium]
MGAPSDDAVAAAREAIARRDWARALELYQTAVAAGPLSPAEMETMADVAWCVGMVEQRKAALEAAYAGYMRDGQKARAAYVAILLARDHGQGLSASVSAGWLKRAERLLESEPEAVEHGFLYGRRAMLAYIGGDFDRAVELARRAIEIGERQGNVDLQGHGKNVEGIVLVARGAVAEGLGIIDEAALTAISGEMRPYWASSVCCNTISACCEIADYSRALEWADAAAKWGESCSIDGLQVDCRMHQAEVLVLRGSWAEAEEASRRAVEEMGRAGRLAHVGEAHYQIGEVRLRLGDLDAAEEEMRLASELGRDPQPGLSLLLLAQGKTKAALAAITRAVEEQTKHRLDRARLLVAAVPIALASGDLREAQAAAEELQVIASEFASPALRAGAQGARGAVLLAAGDHLEAARVLRVAVAEWQAVSAPYEVARVRTLLGRAIAARGDHEGAKLELQAARSAFLKLGARLDLELVDQMLSAGPEPLAPVHDQKAFLFSDIVKSTNLVEAIGDDAWVDLLRWHDETLRAIFAQHGGEEVDHAG